MVGIVTAVGALLALVVGLDTIAGERERGSLVPLLLTPSRATASCSASSAGVAVAWVVMYWLAVPYLWRSAVPARTLPPGCSRWRCWGRRSCSDSVSSHGTRRRLPMARTGLLIGLIALLLAASPLLLGPACGNRRSAVPSTPSIRFSAAVNAYDAVIIDSQAITAQAANLVVTLVWLALALWFARAGVRRVAR